jgi:hypothetical protein
MFDSILNATASSTLPPGAPLLCLGASLALGLCIALVYMFATPTASTLSSP